MSQTETNPQAKDLETSLYHIKMQQGCFFTRVTYRCLGGGSLSIGMLLILQKLSIPLVPLYFKPLCFPACLNGFSRKHFSFSTLPLSKNFLLVVLLFKTSLFTYSLFSQLLVLHDYLGYHCYSFFRSKTSTSEIMPCHITY